MAVLTQTKSSQIRRRKKESCRLLLDDDEGIVDCVGVGLEDSSSEELSYREVNGGRSNRESSSDELSSCEVNGGMSEARLA